MKAYHNVRAVIYKNRNCKENKFLQGLNLSKTHGQKLYIFFDWSQSSTVYVGYCDVLEIMTKRQCECYYSLKYTKLSYLENQMCLGKIIDFQCSLKSQTKFTRLPFNRDSIIPINYIVNKLSSLFFCKETETLCRVKWKTFHSGCHKIISTR